MCCIVMGGKEVRKCFVSRDMWKCVASMLGKLSDGGVGNFNFPQLHMCVRKTSFICSYNQNLFIHNYMILKQLLTVDCCVFS
jgi:hypothetical protein